MIYRFDEIASTNGYAKTLLKTRRDAVILAKRQTDGKGTKGRSFSSNEGGVYLTKLAFYEDFPSKDAFLIMARTATAVCKTLEKFGFQPSIKWPNDVFLKGRKVCGILIENTFFKQKISASIIGVGLNVNNLLPPELKDVAISMQEAGGKEYPLPEVEKALQENLEEPFAMAEYLARLGFMGEEAILIRGEEKKKVTLLSVDEKGVLYVMEDGAQKEVSSGEVSLRLYSVDAKKDSGEK